MYRGFEVGAPRFEVGGWRFGVRGFKAHWGKETRVRSGKETRNMSAMDSKMVTHGPPRPFSMHRGPCLCPFNETDEKLPYIDLWVPANIYIARDAPLSQILFLYLSPLVAWLMQGGELRRRGRLEPTYRDDHNPKHICESISLAMQSIHAFLCCTHAAEKLKLCKHTAFMCPFNYTK